MTLTDIRSALDGLGVRPRQVLGQNFLHDANVARRIAEAVGSGGFGTLIEIGPGLGSLTEQLVGRAPRVVVIEKDAAMVRWLAARFGPEAIEVVHADALDYDLRPLWAGGPLKVVGNLPYYVSTPLIAKYAAGASPALELVLTLQSEVAERLAARPGERGYGAMSVCVQRRWEVALLRRLPASVFYPAPKVGSALVRLTRKPAPLLRPLDDAHFEALVRRGFAERRKQLKNLLPDLRETWPDLATALGAPATARAEDLGLEQWEELAVRSRPAAAQRDAEMFDVVDAGDRVTGLRPREFVHVNNLRHRAVHVLLFNAAGDLFLQRRSAWKDLNPSVWDSSVAGHVDAGETYAEAATRETREELGVAPDLDKLGKLESSAKTSWEFVEIYGGRCEGPFQLARLEIDAGAFFPVPLIGEWLAQRPQDFSPLFRQIFPRFVSGLASPGGPDTNTRR